MTLCTPTTLLAHAVHEGLAPLDVRVLVAHALGVPRIWLITHGDDALSPVQCDAARAAIARRAAGEPVAYITGQREFYGLMLHVSPAVLIPRPETEWLVEFAATNAPTGGHVADIGCGSGAIAVALAHKRPDLQVLATDVSTEALDIARANAQQHGVAARVRFACGDLYAPLEGAQFDMIVSNPPYIAAQDVHLQQGDLRFEPSLALTDRADGLALLRRLAQGASARLNPGGWLALEHGFDQGQAVATLLAQAGLENVATHTDLSAQPRNTVAQKARARSSG
ncbi:MAG: peptide chain release factor N(5)-glutamine methyltransferase [Burkholderiaceae bacterium]